MATTKSKAKPAKVVQDAANVAVQGYNSANVCNALRAMSEGRKVTDEATGKIQDAAVALCREAQNVALASLEVGMDSESITEGWSASLRADLPKLHSEGCAFVSESDKKDGKYVLTGYGQNVNSAARGFCQYPGELTVDGCANEDGEVTISSVMAAVKARRAEDDSAELKALKAAKQNLADAIKLYRDAANEGRSAARINEFAQALCDAVELDRLENAVPEAETVETETVETESKAA